MKNEELVSIIIPYYDYYDWLIEALKSVEKQTFKNFEVIVVDDGSKDFEKLEKLNDKFNFKLKVLHKKNGGPASARNFGIENSTGKYIAFLDSDDYWSENKLEVQICEMERKGSFWSQHSYKYIYENNKKKSIDTSMYSGNILEYTFVSFKVQTSCVIVQRSILLEGEVYKILFPEDKRFGQDTYFYRELAKKTELLSINQELSFFRIRGNNAGFRSKIQLKHKSELWDEEKKRDLKRCSKLVRISYFLSHINYNLTKKFFSDNFENETVYRLFYAFPYFLLKIEYLRLSL